MTTCVFYLILYIYTNAKLKYDFLTIDIIFSIFINTLINMHVFFLFDLMFIYIYIYIYIYICTHMKTKL